MKLKKFANKKVKTKENKNNKIKVTTIIACVVILIAGIMLYTYSVFSVSTKFNVMHAKVGNFIQNDFTLLAYVNGSASGVIPTKNAGYYVQKIECDNDAVGMWDDDTWNIIIHNATLSNTSCSIFFSNTSDPNSVTLATFIRNKVSTESTLMEDTTSDKNARYINLTEKNYITFNDETWRIIGVFGNNVKIIRDEALSETKAWDSNTTKSNDWALSTIKDYLNEEYLYEIDDESRMMIEKYPWNVGKMQTYDVRVSSTYTYEKNAKYKCYIGLMNISDYVNATTASNCSSQPLNNFENSNYYCTRQNWLTISGKTIWTITGSTQSNTYVYGIQNYGSTYTSVAVISSSEANNVRPALYLKDSVIITNSSTADGTNNNQYEISL